MLKNASWITSPKDAGVAVYSYRREFSLSKPVKKAVLRATAVGVYTAEMNGTRIGNAVLAPGWTSYQNRLQVQTYDVTNLLQNGDNTLSIAVGQGWAVGTIGFRTRNHYAGDHVSAIAELTVTYENGKQEIIGTSKNWDVYTTPVLSTDIYNGETVDLTAPVEKVGKAVPDNTVKARLIPQVGEWITEHERIAPVAVFRTPKNELVIDFGQNMTGYVEVRIKAPRGSRVVLNHAEVLDKDGNFYNANYRTARNENVYVCSGGEDVFKPSYTFQGFRYIRLNEFPFDTVNLDDFRAIVVHSDMKRTGYFLCGNEKINQLYHNIIWGQKSNYLDIPTDCPQRDERLGWTGDTQVFCRTGAINFNTEKFFRKWLADVALEQHEDGGVEGIVPDPLDRKCRVSAAWGDVACIVPWEIYKAFGNKADLKKQLPMMKKWVEYIHHAGPQEYLWLGGFHYGDWLAMDAGEDSYVGATSNDLIASAFFAYSTSLLIKAGEAVGEDMSEYRELYKNVRNAFRSYFMENGMPKEEFPFTEVGRASHAPVDTVRKGMTQTAIVLILHFDLCNDDERPALAEKLVELIHANGDRMTTGFVGTPYLLHALSENGYTDIAYMLLMQEKNPSWLYSVCHGATTMWEHWNSLKEDGSFWSTDMNSFNHYAYGAVFDWIFGVACGIKTCDSAPAYRHIDIAPKPNKCLGFADASIETKFGKVRVHWYYKGDRVAYEIEIPQGATATVTLDGKEPMELSAGSYLF